MARTLGARFQTLHGWQVVQAYAGVEEETAAARRSVALADVSAAGKITLQGERASTVLESVLGVSAPEVGAGVAVPVGRLFRLREDLFLVWIRFGEGERPLQELRNGLSDVEALVTVTDVTHGRAALRLVGPESGTVLARLCGLDFSPRAFPNPAIRASSVAKTPQWVLRDDQGELPSFVVLGARSLGEYLWEIISEAGRDQGIFPIGQEALEELS